MVLIGENMTNEEKISIITEIEKYFEALLSGKKYVMNLSSCELKEGLEEIKQSLWEELYEISAQTN